MQVLSAWLFVILNVTLNRTPGEIVLKGKGYHTIELVLSGYEPVKDVYYVDQPKTIKVKLTPLLLPSQKKNTSDFYIMINSTPQGASIWIDENRTSMETPSKIFFKSEGTHKLGLSLLGYKDYLGNISVSKAESINVNLEPSVTPEPNIETPDSVWPSIAGLIFSYLLYKRKSN
jgi:hypothetical protein